ncbi:MAG TPA: NAD(P)/FAD-dependent oxidoreductase [Stellaceae bacterium]|nr:NAD(P)/FAD-dependent oxidoreductase [Stellaceae bacterium]
MPDFDAIIIGGGHNGLACAACLARGGRRVLVLEARKLVGGFATTEAPFANLPHIISPMASMDLATANMPPSIIDDLRLAEHGLGLIEVDPFYSHVTQDGRSFAFWRSIDRTCAEIAQFSARDARRYREMTAAFIALWRTMSPYLHAHPRRPGIGTIASVLTAAIRSQAGLRGAARALFSSPYAVIEENFESPALRAALAIFAAASGSPLDEPGSGLIMAMMAMQHEWGVRRPKGGMGAFSDALRRAAEAHGAEIRTGCPVRGVIMQQDRAVGVETADGEAIFARNVIAALDPITLFTKLVSTGAVPEKLQRELKALGVWRANLAPMRVDLAVLGKPEMVVPAERAEVLLPTSTLLGPGFEATQQFLKVAAAGHLPDGDIPIWPASPSRLDRSLVAGEAELETFYIFVPAVPYRLAGGARWSDLREVVAERVISTMGRVMPGIGGRIIGRSVRTPQDIEETSGIHRGSAYHADLSLAQMGVWRPTPSLAGYETPIAGLWHTAAGAHPVAGVNGLAGAIAARTVLRRGFA